MMRLWHYKLIPFLPNSQLLAQWRELNSIYKKQDKHILINYVYEYPREDLLAYSLLVISEMNERGIEIKKTENFDSYFSGVYVKNIPNLENFIPFKEHHNNRYLLQCFYNLQEKYDRGQKDFRYGLYLDLEDFVKNQRKEVR